MRYYTRRPFLGLLAGTLVSAFVAGSLAACSDLTSPNAGLEIALVPQRSSAAVAPAPNVAAFAGVVSFDGQLTTPTPCYTFTRGADVTHDTLVVRVVAKRTGTACEQAIQNWMYHATVYHVSASVVALRVSFDPGNGAASVVLEQPVTTP